MENMKKMYLIMLNEYYNKVIIGEYDLSTCINEDCFEKWKRPILSQARKEYYPEAQGFYFQWEGSSYWQCEMTAKVELPFDDFDDDFEDDIFEYNE